MRSFPRRDPVFVDATGRRQRTIRRIGALLVLPAGGYVLLLVSSLLGGPSPDTPLIPLPDAVRPLSKPSPTSTPTKAVTEAPVPPASATTPSGPTSPGPSVVPSQASTIAPTGRPTTSVATATPTNGSSPTTTPGAAQRGKPTIAPGKTKAPGPS